MVRRPHQPGCGRHVLISGAGVAGPAAAYWFLRAGWHVTLVEVAPQPRVGGYMIDFWGAGFEVVERMGLGPVLRERGYRFGELRLVDARGRPEARLKVDALTRALGEQYVSILRTQLADLLLEAVVDQIEIRFDDEIAALQPLDGKVATRFRRGGSERFDLVVGADGLHSNVRALAWLESEARVNPLGYLVAALTVSGYPHGDEGAYVSRTVPGRQVARYRLRDGRTTFFFIFAEELAPGRPSGSLAEQKALLADIYRDVGWEAAEILAATEGAEDIYFDSASQVQALTWAKGRCALLGDAAYCPSFLAGEGASFAIAGAYVLASEVARAGPDVELGLAAYEARLRPFIEQKQRAARRFGAWFAPRTLPGVFLRNQLTKLAGLPGLSKWVGERMFADRLDLPAFPA